jgi:hypothetical protein
VLVVIGESHSRKTVKFENMSGLDLFHFISFRSKTDSNTLAELLLNDKFTWKNIHQVFLSQQVIFLEEGGGKIDL